MRLIAAAGAAACLVAVLAPEAPRDPFAGDRFVEGLAAYRAGDHRQIERSLAALRARTDDEGARAAAQRLGQLSVAARRAPPLTEEARFLYAAQLCEPPSWVDTLASLPITADMPLLGEREASCIRARPLMAAWSADLAGRHPGSAQDRMRQASRTLASRGMAVRPPWTWGDDHGEMDEEAEAAFKAGPQLPAAFTQSRVDR